MKFLITILICFTHSVSTFSQKYTLRIVSPEGKVIGYKVKIGKTSFASDITGSINLKNQFFNANRQRKIALYFNNSTDGLFYSKLDFCKSIVSEKYIFDEKIVLLKGEDCNISFERMLLKDIFTSHSIRLYFSNNEHTNTN